MSDTPLNDEEVGRLACALLALDLPEACRTGVAANLAALAAHARRISGEEHA